MLFQTSTPKQKRTLVPLPRSSTPNKFYNLIKNKIKHARINDKNCCQHYQISIIKLDLLLYRPKTESYRRQTWEI